MFRMHCCNPPTCVNLCLGSTLLLSWDLNDARDHLAVDLDVGTRPLRNETNKSCLFVLHPGRLTCWTPKNGGLDDAFPFQLGDFFGSMWIFPECRGCDYHVLPSYLHVFVAIRFYFNILALALNQAVFHWMRLSQQWSFEHSWKVSILYHTQSIAVR